MEDDNSNDVVLIEDEDSMQSTSTDTKDYLKRVNDETRPLMSLLERLTSNDTKSNTILTNAQILSILIKEFDMDASTLHDLEIDIYINIVKKFLKDWPQWDDFDQTMNRLKKKGSNDEIKDILEQKYKHLKLYLHTMIDIAMPLTNTAVKKAKSSPEAKSTEDNNIVLEVYCTRKALNTFIYNQPNPAENNSIFNLQPYEPMKLNPSAPIYSFSSLLNWYGVRFTIDLPFFQYSRHTAYQLKHVLVNDKNGTRDLKEKLDINVYKKKQPKMLTNQILISCINDFLYKIMAYYENSIEYDMIKSIFSVIRSDLDFDSEIVDIPGSYRHNANKYPYVRKLNSKVESTRSSHNLYIEEKIIPIQDWHIGKFFVNLTSVADIPPLQNWLKFECEECKQKFNGAEFLTLLQEHFKVYHIDEPDWTCVNCERSFTMAKITNRGWKHIC